jgi:hypothetical protein
MKDMCEWRRRQKPLHINHPRPGLLISPPICYPARLFW